MRDHGRAQAIAALRCAREVDDLVAVALFEAEGTHLVGELARLRVASLRLLAGLAQGLDDSPLDLGQGAVLS